MATLPLGFTPALGNRSARKLFLAVLLVCVLCAQALGFMHGIVHAFHDDEAQATQAASASEVAHEAATPESHDWLDALFADHNDASDCRLFDALGQQYGATFSSTDLPWVLMPCTRVQRPLLGAFVARWAALFEARGPPSSH